MRKITTRDLAFTAMIAALYTALCLALAPLSFGMVQVRAAEALTLLPVFSPVGIWGVALGCALSNLAGFFTGATMLPDVLFGTSATLIAALMSRRLRNVRTFGLPVAAAIPPVLVNAVVIGAELAIFFSPGENFLKMLVINGLYVGVGQILACFGLGLPMVWLLEKSGAARRCFGEDAARPVKAATEEGRPT